MTDHLLSLGGPPRPLAPLTDAELILLDAVVGSGGQVRPRNPQDAAEATEALALDSHLRVAIQGEIRARRLSREQVAGRLVDRALGALGP